MRLGITERIGQTDKIASPSTQECVPARVSIIGRWFTSTGGCFYDVPMSFID